MIFAFKTVGRIGGLESKGCLVAKLLLETRFSDLLEYQNFF